MATIKGVFQGCSSKNGTSKKTGKPYKLYSIIVDGKKYGWGFEAPTIAADTVVEFNAAENERGYMEADPDSLKELGAAPSAAKTNSTSNSNATSNSDPRQASIEIQSSIASASRIVAAQITAGVKIPNPLDAVASLVAGYLGILHPPTKPAKAKAAPPPAGADVGDGDDIPF